LSLGDVGEHLGQQEVSNNICAYLDLKTVFCYTKRRVHNPSVIDEAVYAVITSLKIVARLPENEYSVSKSNGHIRRQVEVLKHPDLPDPASDVGTSQG